MNKKLTLAIVLSFSSSVSMAALSTEQLQESLDDLERQVAAMKAELAKSSNDQSSQASASSENYLSIGGAVRFNYQVNDSNTRRGGEFKFDTFRLDINGQYNGILIGSKWRWFEDKALIQTAWMGYNITPTSQVRLGLDLIPFGNQEYNSHNFDLSPNFQLGLEDNYAFGGTYHYKGDALDVQAGLFKNSSSRLTGGDKNYSPNLIGVGSAKDPNGKPSTKADTVDTAAVRVVYTFKPAQDVNIQVGSSGLFGGVASEQGNIGEYGAFALHSEITFKRLHLQLQATHYEYDLKEGEGKLIRGFYGNQITAATRANSYTANVAYKLPVKIGPIERLDFYNDYTLVTDKPNNAADSYDNAVGLGIAAGAVYVFLDWHVQQNMGDMTALNESTSHYFNANFGYYF